MSRGLAPTRPVSRRLSLVALNIARSVTSSRLSPRCVRNWRSRKPSSRRRNVGLPSTATLAPEVQRTSTEKQIGFCVTQWRIATEKRTCETRLRGSLSNQKRPADVYLGYSPKSYNHGE